MRYWLMKSEPTEFSIDDLAASPAATAHWDGVRNYQARNMMRDQMKRGDQAFYYHSNCAAPGVVGTVRIVREGYPDHTAFDPHDPHYDPKSDPDAPRWYMVDVKLARKFRRIIPLAQLKRYADRELADMALLRRGNRLSVMPVTQEEWAFIVALDAASSR